MTTTSRATYTEERELISRKQFIISLLLVSVGATISYSVYFPAFLCILPLALLLFAFRDWKMLTNYNILISNGVIRFEPKFRSNRREAFRSLILVISILSTPMVLSPFLPPLPWLGLSLGIVMAWPASNLVEFFFSYLINRATGKKLLKFYTWYSVSNEVAMKDYGWLLK